MEILLLIIVLILLIVLFNVLSSNTKAVKKLEDQVYSLRQEIRQFNTQPAFQESKPIVPFVEQPEENPVISTPLTGFVQPTEPVKIEETRQTETDEVMAAAAATPTAPLPEFKKSWFEQWLHDNPDIEKFIGENLINKVGIAVLVLGIAFFVKYAIDQEWINKVGRVCIGLLCGGLLIGIAHRLRKNYHSFSSVLVGGGLAVFYFTIAFAFHQYHLIGQTAAFVIMVIISLFAVILSVLYNRIELGIIATIGGFLTPFLVSTGDGNYVVLFSYLCILNAGLIVLAYYKRWRTLNFLAFIFTELIYAGWIVQKAGTTDFPYKGTFIFGAVFYMMFVVMNVIHHVSRASKLKAFDFMILLSVNLFFYASGLYLLQLWGYDFYEGLFTALLGLINLAMAYLFFRKSKADKNFIYLLIGITVTFISLTAPVQLKGRQITLFWSAEMVVLLWLYQKSLIRLIKIASVLVGALMLCSLFMDWSSAYLQGNEKIVTAVFNKEFVTGFFAALAMFASCLLLQKKADAFFIGGINNNSLRRFYLTGAIVLAFLTGALEINAQFANRFPGTGFEFLYLQLYIVAFFLVLFIVLEKLHTAIHPNIRLLTPLLIAAVCLLNLANSYSIEQSVLTTGINRGYFMANWITVMLLFWLAFNTIQYVKRNKLALIKSIPLFTWIITIVMVVLLSYEVGYLFIWLTYFNRDSILNSEAVYQRAGLSILWGISSFIIIWLGMSHRYKPLRIIALLLFGVTLIKLFVFDIKNIAPAGKIIAFILLGVLLLIISFMYQRLKKIIIDDTQNAQ